MSEQLLTVLKFCLLALLYLFLFRVVRAVWAEITPPRPMPAGQPPNSGVDAPRPARRARPTQAAPVPGAATGVPVLIVIEPPEQAGRTYTLGSELSVGRSAGCQITVDDTFVSQLHARIYQRDGQYLVEDLGSTNGTYLNRTKVVGTMVMHASDRLQVGNTVLELA